MRRIGLAVVLALNIAAAVAEAQPAGKVYRIERTARHSEQSALRPRLGEVAPNTLGHLRAAPPSRECACLR